MRIIEKLLEPSLAISEAREKYMKQAEGCLAKQIAPRLLSAAQLLVSIVALPIILLVGLLETTFRLCTCSSDILNTLKATLLLFEMHLGILIPVNFMGIFLPFSATQKLQQTLANCQEPIYKCLEVPEQNNQSTTQETEWPQG